MKKLIIAHRGASGYKKENTLGSFALAIEMGADMIEFDVRKSADGEFVIIHNRKIASKKISQLSREKISEILGFHVPGLEESLQFLQGKIKLDLELKEEGCEEEVTELVLRYFKPQDFIVSSFNKNSILKIKKEYPNVQTGLLGSSKNLLSFLTAKRIKPDYFLPSIKLARLPLFLSICKFLHLQTIIWTVNDKKEMEKFLKRENVVGIITDYPDILSKKTS